MKKLITIFAILPLSVFAQNIKTGKWSCNGVIITRTDSVQIEDYNGKIDTLRIQWIDEKRYTLTGAKTALNVVITKIRPWGYSGLISDGVRSKKFEFVNVR